MISWLSCNIYRKHLNITDKITLQALTYCSIARWNSTHMQLCWRTQTAGLPPVETICAGSSRQMVSESTATGVSFCLLSHHRRWSAPHRCSQHALGGGPAGFQCHAWIINGAGVITVRDRKCSRPLGSLCIPDFLWFTYERYLERLPNSDFFSDCQLGFLQSIDLREKEYLYIFKAFFVS